MSPSGVVVPLLLPPVSDISSLINVLLISSSWQVLIAHGSTYLFQRNSPCPGTRHAVDPGAEGSAGPATFPPYQIQAAWAGLQLEVVFTCASSLLRAFTR